MADPHPCGCSGLASLLRRLLSATETGEPMELSPDDISRMRTATGDAGAGKPGQVKLVRAGGATELVDGAGLVAALHRPGAAPITHVELV